MPTFDTTGPVNAVIDIADGDIRIEAADRTDIIVDVVPTDPNREADRNSADKASVTFEKGQLTVAVPKHIFSSSGATNVRVQLPAKSQLQIDAKSATVQVAGDLGDIAVKSSTGRVEIEHAVGVTLDSGRGDVTINSISGDANITVRSGTAILGTLEGKVTVKAANGSTRIGSAHGHLTVTAENGAIEVGELTAGAELRAANGSIRVGEVAGSGKVLANTAFGDVETGVRAGVVVKLDLHTGYGTVRNGLDEAEAAGSPGEALELAAHSGSGDVIVHRV